MKLIYIYVDDILVFCADRVVLNGIKATVKERFSIKDLGTVKRCLGV